MFREMYDSHLFVLLYSRQKLQDFILVLNLFSLNCQKAMLLVQHSLNMNCDKDISGICVYVYLFIFCSL